MAGLPKKIFVAHGYLEDTALPALMSIKMSRASVVVLIENMQQHAAGRAMIQLVRLSDAALSGFRPSGGFRSSGTKSALCQPESKGQIDSFGFLSRAPRKR